MTLCLLFVACGDEVPTEPPDVDPVAGPVEVADESAYPEVELGPASMRRLTRAQLANSIHSVFGDAIVVPDVAEPDVVVAGLVAVGASNTSFSARGVESVERTATAVAEQVMDDPEARGRWVTCTPSATVDADCAAEIVAGLGRMLWRRPLTDDERARLVAIAGAAAEALGEFDAGLEYALTALLQSPHFLFRVEVGEADPEPPGGRRFSGWEMASRLSYFLWNTTPDAALLDAAEAGRLTTRKGLREEAERLLAAPEARAGMRDFFTDYLELNALDHLAKDPTLFEHFSTLLGPSAREETLRLLEHYVFDVDADYREVMTTRETFINPRLAALYAVPAPVPEGFGRVRLPEGAHRAGLLGHASILAHNAHAVSSSATLRGKFMRTVLLCQTIPPPPVNVDTSIPEPSGETLTLRDRVAEHLENPTCQGCHLLTDPIGLGLENFDGLGRWREKDHGETIDPTGDLDGETFDDALGLGVLVGAHPAFTRCLATTLVRYANGRVEESDEQLLLNVLAERFQVHRFRVRPLVLEIVTSPLFRAPGEAN